MHEVISSSLTVPTTKREAGFYLPLSLRRGRSKDSSRPRSGLFVRGALCRAPLWAGGKPLPSPPHRMCGRDVPKIRAGREADCSCAERFAERPHGREASPYRPTACVAGTYQRPEPAAKRLARSGLFVRGALCRTPHGREASPYRPHPTACVAGTYQRLEPAAKRAVRARSALPSAPTGGRQALTVPPQRERTDFSRPATRSGRFPILTMLPHCAILMVDGNKANRPAKVAFSRFRTFPKETPARAARAGNGRPMR